MIYEISPAKQDLFAIPYIAENLVLSIDTETTGIEETDRLFCVTLSGPEHQVYVDKDSLQLLESFFADPFRTWYLQNPKFDMRMLLNEGYTLAGTIIDAAVLGRLVRNDHLKYNLKSLAAREGLQKLDVVEKEITKNQLYEIRKTNLGETYKAPRFDWVDREILKLYACVDADVTYKVCHRLMQKLQEPGDEGNPLAVLNVETPLTKVCFNMERRGILLNVPYTEEAMGFELERTQLLKEAFLKEVGEEFVDSGKALSPVFKKYGLPIATTAKGNPSFTDEVLEKYQHPVAEIVRDIRESQKTISTYYVNFINMRDSCDVIHPTMWQAGTRTGRFSYSEPNLQQLTKDKADSPKKYLVRGCFMPRPGRAFISMDYSQQEYRMMLAYANERELIKKVMDGEDVHQATADLLGIDRQSAKTLNFACIAEGSLVLTDGGLVPIERVSASAKVWDGVAFVPHAGVVYQGEREVIEYAGLTATPDHKVFTECGRYVSLGDLAAQPGKYRVARTEIDGVPCRYAYPELSAYGPGAETPDYRGSVLRMWANISNRVWKYPSREHNKLPLPAGGKAPRGGAGACQGVIQTVLGSSYAMHFASGQALEKLRRAWGRGSTFLRGVCAIFLGDILPRGNSPEGNGSHRQQWPLCTGEPATGDTRRESAQSKVVKVYDILNAGPRRRFTVSGVLVSNCLYGAGVDKLARMLKVSKVQAQRFKDQYFMRLPRVERFIDEVIRRGRSRGFVYNWAGRRLYASREFAYALPNHLIQGGGADVVKRAMVEIGEHECMLLQVHDQLIFEPYLDEAEEVVRKCQPIMENAFPEMNGMRLKVDVTYSTESLAERDMKKWGT